MLKKILLFLIFILLLSVGVFFYVMNTKGDNPENPNQTFSERPFDIFPTGKSEQPESVVENQNQEEDSVPEITLEESPKEGFVPKLRKLYEKPVSGATILEKKETVLVDGKNATKIVYVIRFMDKETGHIYDLAYDSKTLLKRSNKTIPKMHESVFSGDGNTVVSRFLGVDNETVKTYSILLKNQSFTSTSTLEERLLKSAETSFLPSNMKDLVMSPDKTKIAYLLYGENGGEIYVRNINSGQTVKVFESPLREWLLNWQNNTNLILSTRPSGYVQGGAYILNTTNGSFSKIIGKKIGLTIKPSFEPSYYLFGEGGENLNTFILNTKDSSEVSLGLKTLPEKCVSKNNSSEFVCAVPSFVEDSLYPEMWYLGAKTFSDSFWNITSSIGETNFIVSPTTINENIDAINLSISTDNNYLIFINKKDQTLWGLSLLNENIKEATTTPIIN